MNIKKIIKYTLIAIPLIFLAKWGIETAIYNSNKTPEINPHPTHKMKIHGNFPLNNARINFNIGYVNNNRKCDDTNWFAGTRFPQRREITFPTNIKNGTFESIIYLDYYLPGLCDYSPAYMGFNFENKKTNQHGNTNFIKFTNKNTPKHATSFYCSEWKFDNKVIRCELEQDKYFINNIQKDDNLKLYYFLFNHNEISTSHKELEINFTFQGEK